MAEPVPGWRLLAVGLALSLVLGGAAGAIAGWRHRPATVVTAAAVPPAPLDAARVEVVVPDSVDRLAPSVVAVRAAVESTEPDALLVESSGTGFVVRSDGRIVTAAHVIEHAWSVSVVLATGDEVAASVVAVDAATDLALLEVDRDGLAPVSFGRLADLRVGEAVVAVGHAHGLGDKPSVSVGVLSAVERSIAGSDGVVYDHLLQTDAAIDMGVSGGPLVDGTGLVIGINTAKITTDDAEGLGSAICADHALPALEAMLAR